MPHRQPLLDLLTAYNPTSAEENLARDGIVSFVQENADCFLRTNISGHITGSSWLIDPTGEQVLLTHHKKMGAWLQLGGHADGDPDILAVTLREAHEESGIKGIVAHSPEIFDVDIHLIERFNHVPAHYHYDVRFVLRAPHRNVLVSDESHALAWKSIKTIAQDNTNPSLQRMAKKWLASSSTRKFFSPV